MGLYFAAAEGIPVIKIGCTADADMSRRMTALQHWSPVPLRVAAWDARGDYLTEADLLSRFASERLHGEWFAASSGLRAVVSAVAEGLPVPGGLYLPEGYPASAYGRAYSAPISTLQERFALSRDDVVAALGRDVFGNHRNGLGPVAMARFYRHLRAAGHDITIRDLLPDKWRTPVEVGA